MMRSRSALFVKVIALFLAQGVSCLDLRLDIAGGDCHDDSDFDNTFDEGVMPATQEMMDITTTTENEESKRRYGFSAFRGDKLPPLATDTGATTESRESESITPPVTLQNNGGLRRLSNFEGNTETNNATTEVDIDTEENRDLEIETDCPVFHECPGSGDPTHWCAWICGYWSNNRVDPNPELEPEEARREDHGFLRRVMEDLQIPEEERDHVQEHLQPIRYTADDRKLLLNIEGLVCGWIQRWLDSRFSRCLHGATLLTCRLDLRS